MAIEQAASNPNATEDDKLYWQHELEAFDEAFGSMVAKEGATQEDPLWKFFGLSYSSWLTLPRVLMHAMPAKWKIDMYRLLNEWDDTWKAGVVPSTRVLTTNDNGKLIKTPGWLQNYRHPDQAGLNNLKYPSKRKE